jgi:actin-related protein
MKRAQTPTDLAESFELPDRKLLVISDERFRSPEPLFKPSINRFDLNRVDQMVFDSIMSTYVGLQRQLYKNIVLGGGSTLFTGFAERLETEVRKRAPSNVNANVVAEPHREYSAWFGGSIYA